MTAANFQNCLTITPERWLPVVGHEGRYEVSDLGRIRSLLGKAPRIMRQTPNKKSRYLYLYLMDANGKPHMRTAHTIVLEAFTGPRPAKHDCCHFDGEPSNNRSSNLRWGTRSENMADAIRHGTTTKGRATMHGEGHYAARLTEDDVRCIRAEPAFPGVLKMLATAFDVSTYTISAVRGRANWSHVE